MGDETTAERMRRKGRVVSEFGSKCVLFAERLYHGLHHFPTDPGKVDWSSDCTVFWPHYGELATFDGEDLTKVVLMAHDMGLRVSVKGIGPNYMRIMLHRRDVPMTPSGFRAHPTMETALARWRERNPARPEPTEEGR